MRDSNRDDAVRHSSCLCRRVTVYNDISARNGGYGDESPRIGWGHGGEAYTVSSQIPQREGYEFIDWTLDYGVGYKVTYVVNPDKTWATPEGSTVPTDPNVYAPGEMVDVHDQLTTTVGYAYNENDEKVLGTWTFISWDKHDFEITEDTTITGGWRFDPAPVTKYHYTVEYWLWDGRKVKKVHADKSVEIDSLGILRREDAIPIDQLKKPYCNKDKKGNYLYRIVTPYQETRISYDGYIITILYEKTRKDKLSIRIRCC